MTGYFDPLPKSGIDQAKVVKWVQEQTNTFYRHITLNGLTSSDTILLADGSLAAPSLSFSATGQQDVGIFRDGNDAIAFAINGAKPVRITQTVIDMANVVRLADGSAATPAYSFSTSGREDDGIFSAAEGAVGVAVGGAEVARFTANGVYGVAGDCQSLDENVTGITNSAAADLDALTGGSFSGPLIVTVTTGTRVKVAVSANLVDNDTSNGFTILGYRISGATTRAQSNSHAALHNGLNAQSIHFEEEITVTAGVNVFEAQALVTAGTAGQIRTPTLSVTPLDLP